MLSTTVLLTYYGLIMLVRTRRLAAGLLLLAAMTGLVCRIADWGSVWLCGLGFVAAVGALSWLRWYLGKSNGLLAAMRCAGASTKALVLSQAAVVVVVVAVQMAVTAVVLWALP